MNLTESEKNALISFVEHPVMFNAVRKVLHEKLEDKSFDEKLSNEILGQQFRAERYAEELLNIGFEKLQTYKRIEQKLPQRNEAR